MSQVRSVTVRLSASSAGYVAGVGRAKAANEGLEQSLKGLEKRSQSTEKTMRQIGTVGKVVFGAAALGIAATTKVTADYQAELSAVKSLSHATGVEMRQLDDAARSLGKGIGFSATEAAQGEQELVKAGVSVKDILGGGLKGALDLAAAGQTDVATAAEVASSAMVQFGLAGKDVPHIADLLAAGADKALGSVTDLGYGLSQVGTTANQMGFSIEETVGTLAEFASAGLIGEKGGTTLKQMFLQLAAPTEKARGLMKKYGVSLYDAQGQIKPLAKLAGDLQKSFKDLDPATRNYALGVIFGSHAVQGANILIKDGEAANRKWTKSVNDQGFAAQQAAGKMDNLKGDAKKLRAELENALIGQGGKQGFLRGLAQDATDLLKKYNQLSDAQKNLFGKAVVGAAATGGALYVASKIYGLAKDTSALYRGIFKRGAAKAATGVAEGLGERVAKGVTPVYVTNPGFGKPGTGVGGTAGRAGGAAGGPAVAAPFGTLAAEGALASAGALASGFAVAFAASLGLALKGLSDAKKVPEAKANKGTYVGSAYGGVGGYSSKVPNVSSNAMPSAAQLDAAYAAIGQTQSAVQVLKASYDSLPKAVRTRIEVPGSNETIAVVGALAKKYRLTPRQIQTIFETRGDSKATAKAKTLRVMLRSLPKDVQTEIRQNGGEITRKLLLDLQRKYKLTPKQVQTLIALKGMTKARADAGSLIGLLARITDKSVTVRVNTVNSTSPNKRPDGGTGAATSAGGNIFRGGRRYAAGGLDVADRHLPEQFGPGTRVFAEPETKGEAYIPLADDWRRPRARMLTAQTAALLGGQATFNATGSVSQVARQIAGASAGGPREFFIKSGRLELPEGYATISDVHLIADDKLDAVHDTQRGREVRGGH